MRRARLSAISPVPTVRHACRQPRGPAAAALAGTPAVPDPPPAGAGRAVAPLVAALAASDPAAPPLTGCRPVRGNNQPPPFVCLRSGCPASLSPPVAGRHAAT